MYRSQLKSLKSTLTQFEGISASSLPVTHLRRMQERICQRFEEIDEEANACLKKSEKALSLSDYQVLEYAQKHLRRYRQEANQLTALYDTLGNSIQRQIIRENMIKQAGTPRRVDIIEGLILFLIVFVLGLLLFDIACGPEVVRPALLAGSTIFWIDCICCTIFMAEFLWRLSCAEDKKYVWKHHWIDFVTSIPVPGEAQVARFGRIARIARFVRLLRLLRFARLFFIIWRGMDKLQDVINVNVMKKTIRWAVIATCLGAVAIYKLEGTSPPANDTAQTGNSVGTLVQAVWWSFTTVLTGGFGDIHNPSSISGQVVTGILIITGMVVVGVFTATLTSLFIGDDTGERERSQDELQERLAKIETQLELIVPRSKH